MNVKLQLMCSKEAQECQAIGDWMLSLTAFTKWTLLKYAGSVKRTRERESVPYVVLTEMIHRISY